MVPIYVWPDPEERAERLAPVALEFARRIRTDPPLTLWRELMAPLDGWEQAAVACLLAAAVDPTVHPDVLFGWVRYRDAIEAAAPIVWEDDERPIEEMGSREISDLIRRLTGRGRTARQISDETGLSVDMVAKRLERLRRQAGRESRHVSAVPVANTGRERLSEEARAGVG